MAFSSDRERIAHLLRRFGLGASEAEIDYYGRDGKGYRGAVDRLLASDRQEEGVRFTPDLLRNNRGQVNRDVIVALYASDILTSRRPLSEKMALFWHDHFATSMEKVRGDDTMLDQIEIFRTKGLGPFRELLGAVLKDPAMIIWLDAAQNRKGKAQENLAREIMELFTLGIGNYTEKDVQEAARALTGWSLARGVEGIERRTVFMFRPPAHDDGEKTILGKTANFDGDMLMDHLVALPRTSEYIVEKMWKWFVSPKPSPARVKEIATKWRGSGMVVRDLVRDLMLAPEFLAPGSERALYKSPYDFVLPIFRALGLGQITQNRVMAARDADAPQRIQAIRSIPLTASQIMKKMGMYLLHPPDVAGWDGGSAWISSATMVERIAVANLLFGQGRSRGPRTPAYPIYELLAPDPTAAGVVKRLLRIYDAPMAVERQKLLVAAAQKEMGESLTPQNAGKVAAAVSRLIFASPEFQMM